MNDNLLSNIFQYIITYHIIIKNKSTIQVGFE